jgi:RNA polymerase sigma factor (sigma-70 family)
MAKGPGIVVPDSQLLLRFAQQQEQAAFAVLVQRHGAMVLSVCRRMLYDRHEAEDVFQAAFLVLARKAAALPWEDSVGNWLYTVAYRLARHARAAGARRQSHEKPWSSVPGVPLGEEDEAARQPAADANPLLDVARRELRRIVDDELHRLPEKYRAPVVLCYLEGKTNEEAARELGWPTGSISRRLARARELLRQRLDRHGLALSTSLLTTSLVLPEALAQATVQAASSLTPLAGLSTAAPKALHALAAGKVQVAATMLLALGLGGVGVSLLGSAGLGPAGAREVGTPELPEGALEARLIAKKKTYTLDRGPRSPGEAVRPLLSVGDMPSVDLVLELCNRSNQHLDLRLGDGAAGLSLDLQGPGVSRVPEPDSGAPESTGLRLAPGKSQPLAITRLTTGFPGRRECLVWTEPGNYTLTACVDAAVNPAPRGGSDAGDGFGRIVFRSGPITLTVAERIDPLWTRLPVAEHRKLMQVARRVLREELGRDKLDSEARARARTAAFMLAIYAQHSPTGADILEAATLRDAALQLARSVKDDDLADARRQAGALDSLEVNLQADPRPRRFDDAHRLLEVMAQFRPQAEGGFGVTRTFRDLEKGVPGQALPDAGEIVAMAYQTAMVAELLKDRTPAGPDRLQRRWRDLAEDLRASATELAAATQAGQEQKARTAVRMVNATCLNCHDSFRGK